MKMELLTLLGHLSFLLVALSFWLRDIMLLRCMSVVASLSTVTFQLTVPMDPSWMIVNWNLVFVGINSSRIYFIFKEKMAVHFTDDEQEVFETVFNSLTPVEFMRLKRIAEWESVDPGYVFTKENELCTHFYYIHEGIAEVVNKNHTIAELHGGGFIGEMSYTTNGPASATVIARDKVKVMVWEQKSLKKLLTNHPSMQMSLSGILAADLTKKLTKTFSSSAKPAN
jgi:CRP-like cAMP-binding protein